MIEAISIARRYGRAFAVRDVSFTVPRGTTTVLIGPSGSGKSTVLRLLAGLEGLDAGRIRIGGIERRAGAGDPPGIRAEAGMVFQQFNLFPHIDVLRNITLAPQVVRGQARSEAEAEARALLDRVGLSGMGERYPRQLSGGEQQRVAIARALAMRPAVLLFDEPTSSLDPEMIQEVLDVMRGLAREGRTMVVATHEMGFAREAAHQVLFLDRGEVVEAGPPQQLFDAPRSDRAAAFLAKIL